jgi:hypothetical protein
LNGAGPVWTRTVPGWGSGRRLLYDRGIVVGGAARRGSGAFWLIPKSRYSCGKMTVAILQFYTMTHDKKKERHFFIR